jgi:hypothetical protein
MEKLEKHVHFATQSSGWPSALKKASDVAVTLGITEERVLELANALYIPHWRIDGGEPLFQISEVKQWASRNLLAYIGGQDLPIQLRVMIQPPPAVDAPESISEIANLRQVPIGEYPPGVYFLVHHDEVVYIGQSTNPMARIAQHTDKEFSSAYLLPVPSYALDAVEGALIRVMNPKLNSGNKPIAYGPGNRNDDLQALKTYAPGLNPLVSIGERQQSDSPPKATPTKQWRGSNQ